LYRNIDDNCINSSKWSSQEEKNLLELVKKYNNLNWQAISKEIQNNRTPWQCLVHYQRTLNINMVNTSEWSEAEDISLKQAVQLYGQKNWQHIANTLPGRSSQQCVLRYNRSTDCKEGIIGGRWIEEEERRLFLAAIAFELTPSSTPSTSLSTSLSTSISSNSSSNSFDNVLSNVNGNDKRGSYLKVAKVVETKDSNRCREKWVNYLDPTIKNGNFSIEEDVKLRSLVEQHGPKNWSKLAKLLPGMLVSIYLKKFINCNCICKFYIIFLF
jgi:myb proto-oncogene protein